MDSLNNFFKGYGKVANPNHLEDQQFPNPQRRKRLIAVSALLLVSLIIGLMLGALIHESNNESPELLCTDSAESSSKIIRTVCNVTQYPDSCFSAITANNGRRAPRSDPELIFKLTLKASAAELSKLSSALKDMNSEEAALMDCRDQVEDALSRLNESASAMEGPGEKKLTEAKMKDIQTWIGAAVTDQETCLDGLEEMGSRVYDEVKAKMNKSKEYTSNALAIVANFHAILHKLHSVLH